MVILIGFFGCPVFLFIWEFRFGKLICNCWTRLLPGVVRLVLFDWIPFTFYFKNNKLTLICFSLLSFSSIMSSQTVHNCNWVVKPGRVAPISILEYTNKWWRHIFIRVLFYFICCVHRNLSKSNLNPGLKFLFLFLTMNILATIYPTNTHFFIGISVAQPSAWGFGQNSNTLAIARPQIKLFLSKPLISAKSYKNQLN